MQQAVLLNVQIFVVCCRFACMQDWKETLCMTCQASIRHRCKLSTEDAVTDCSQQVYMCAEHEKNDLACARASRSLLSGSSSVAAKDCRKEMAADSNNIAAPTTSKISVGIFKHWCSGKACMEWQISISSLIDTITEQRDHRIYTQPA